MSNEERIHVIEYLETIKPKYVDGIGYEAKPSAEYYAIDTVIGILETEELDE